MEPLCRSQCSLHRGRSFAPNSQTFAILPGGLTAHRAETSPAASLRGSLCCPPSRAGMSFAYSLGSSSPRLSAMDVMAHPGHNHQAQRSLIQTPSPAMHINGQIFVGWFTCSFLLSVLCGPQGVNFSSYKKQCIFVNKVNPPNCRVNFVNLVNCGLTLLRKNIVFLCTRARPYPLILV